MVHRDCLLCSEVTQELARAKEAENQRINGKKQTKKHRVQHFDSKRWMKCKRCGGFVCHRCASLFPDIIESKGIVDYPFVSSCKAFLASTEETCIIEEASESHCCCCKELFQEVTKKRSASGESETVPGEWVEVKAVPAKKGKKKRKKKGNRKCQRSELTDPDGLVNVPHVNGLCGASTKFADLIALATLLLWHRTKGRRRWFTADALFQPWRVSLQ